MNDQSLGRPFLIAVTIAVAVVFFWMVQAFFVPVLLAGVFTVLFFPLYERLSALLGGRRGLASFICCTLLLVLLIVPVYLIADLVRREAMDFYDNVEDDVRVLLTEGEAGFLARLPTPVAAWAERLGLTDIDWQANAQRIAGSAGGFVGEVISRTSRGTFHVLLVLFVTLFTMFYFFLDGRRLVERVKYLTPLPDDHEEAIVQRFVSVSRATVRGTLVIALIQGTLGGIVLWIFGVGSPFLWGVVMILLSIVPVVGGWIVLYPAALIQLLMGNVWQAVGIAIVTAVVVVNVDNLLRPRLVGKEAGMHDLMVFFSTLGGIAVFGPLGFIIGPMIAALFLALLDIYAAEFQTQLTPTPRVVTPGATAPPPGQPTAAMPSGLVDPSAATPDEPPERPAGS